MSSHKDLVEHLAKSVVTDPDAVSVESRNEREGLTYYVTVAPNDVGKIIGKNGRVIAAIRQFVSAAMAKHRKRVFIKVHTEQ